MPVEIQSAFFISNWTHVRAIIFKEVVFVKMRVRLAYYRKMFFAVAGFFEGVAWSADRKREIIYFPFEPCFLIVNILTFPNV
jgi:hypothetical protein